MLIKDIAANCVSECTEDTPLAEVYDLIQNCEHGYVVVVDSTSHRVPIGIVNEPSICRQVITKARHPRSLTAGDVMNSRIRRVPESTAIEACESMLESAGSEPILVINEKRQFSGIVDRGQLARALSSSKRSSPAATEDFGSLGAMRTPARVEIPAFGWVA